MKNLYAEKLDDIVNKCNNTYHSTIKNKPADIKSSTYININKENNNEDPDFKFVDHVRISKYKYIFAKGYTSNWYEEVFLTKKVKNTVPLTYVVNDLNNEEIAGKFYAKGFQKTNQKGFRVEQVIKRKGINLFFKWKC